MEFADYAGVPINEVVFWREENVVEMSAFRVKLKRTGKTKEEPDLVVQGDL